MALVFRPELMTDSSIIETSLSQDLDQSIKLSLSSSRIITECLVFADLFASHSYVSAYLFVGLYLFTGSMSNSWPTHLPCNLYTLPGKSSFHPIAQVLTIIITPNVIQPDVYTRYKSERNRCQAGHREAPDSRSPPQFTCRPEFFDHNEGTPADGALLGWSLLCFEYSRTASGG